MFFSVICLVTAIIDVLLYKDVQYKENNFFKSQQTQLDTHWQDIAGKIAGYFLFFCIFSTK